MRYLKYILLIFLTLKNLYGDFIFDAKFSANRTFDKDLQSKISAYMQRYVGMQAEENILYKAKSFLDALYITDTSSCNFAKKNKNTILFCNIVPQFRLEEIKFINLPNTILKKDLMSSLSVQIGELYKINSNSGEFIRDQLRKKIEAYFFSNGYYNYAIDIDIIFDDKFPKFSIEINIIDGNYIRVSNVTVTGISKNILNIEKYYKDMCFNFLDSIDALLLGTFSCYSLKRQKDVTKKLESKIANLGYIKNKIFVKAKFLDSKDINTPANCKAKKNEPFRCVDLAVKVELGPKVLWEFEIDEELKIERTAFGKFFSNLFFEEYLAKISMPNVDLDDRYDSLVDISELTENITVIDTRNIDDDELQNSMQSIKQYLRSKGHAYSKVSYEQESYDNKEIKIKWIIKPSQNFYISSIRFFPTEIKQFINIHKIYDVINKGALINKNIVTKEDVFDLEGEVLSQLKNKGFLLDNVEALLTTNFDRTIDIDFYVKNPSRQLVNKILIEGSFLPIKKDFFKRLSNCDNFDEDLDTACHNSSFIKEQLERDKNILLEWLKDNNFFYTQIDTQIDGKNPVTITFLVSDQRDSLPLSRRQELKDVIITGNDQTSGAVIKRLLKQGTGEYSQRKLKKGTDYLRETGNFSKIDFKIVSAEYNSDETYFMLGLVERPSKVLDLGLAFSTDQFFSLDLEFFNNNFFGTLIRSESTVEYGFYIGRKSAFNHKLIWPYMFGLPVRFSLSAPSIKYQNLSHTSNPRSLFELSATSNFEIRLSSHWTPYVRYTLKQTHQRALPKTSSLSTFDGLYKNLKTQGKVRGFLTPGITYSNIDNPFDPVKGLENEEWVELSGASLIGGKFFSVLGTKWKFYIPIGHTVLACQISLMRAFIAPSKENFEELSQGESIRKLGGDYSLRGYQEKSIGLEESSLPNTKYAGYLSNISNIELRFPLSDPNKLLKLQGAIFAEEGFLVPCNSLTECRINKISESYKKGYDFGLSVGASLRLILPIGPLSLDYGVSPIHNEQRLHFMLNYSF